MNEPSVEGISTTTWHDDQQHQQQHHHQHQHGEEAKPTLYPAETTDVQLILPNLPGTVPLQKPHSPNAPRIDHVIDAKINAGINPHLDHSHHSQARAKERSDDDDDEDDGDDDVDDNGDDIHDYYNNNTASIPSKSKLTAADHRVIISTALQIHNPSQRDQALISALKGCCTELEAAEEDQARATKRLANARVSFILLNYYYFLIF